MRTTVEIETNDLRRRHLRLVTDKKINQIKIDGEPREDVSIDIETVHGKPGPTVTINGERLDHRVDVYLNGTLHFTDFGPTYEREFGR